MSQKWQDFYLPPDITIWHGRDEIQADRMHQLINCINLLEKKTTDLHQLAFVLIGFCSDEGVRRNQGRIGAKEGPRALRRALANMPIHQEHLTIYDCGDIVCDKGDLFSAQQALAELIALMRAQALQPIVMGGGHETALGHFMGLEKQGLPAIINFDAHFDLRDYTEMDQGNSGTPFKQIAAQCKQSAQPFDYTCLGIQSTANTRSLFETAEALNTSYVLADDFHYGSFEKIQQLIFEKVSSQQPIYVSFCLDVLCGSIAPGVSAPQAHGLFLNQVIPLIQQLAASGQVVGFDVVELSPKHDREDHITAKAAAFIIMEWLHYFKQSVPLKSL